VTPEEYANRYQAARRYRLLRACGGWHTNHTTRQVDLVLRMLHDPAAPLAEVRPGKRARLHVPGDIESPRWLAWVADAR
jgi:hypothetical protein